MNPVGKVKRELKKSKREVKKGWFLWSLLMKTHKEIQNTAVILMPSKNDAYNYYAMLYVNQYLNKIERENAVILTHDKRVIRDAKNFSPNITSVIPWSRKKAKLLMKYASLYEFDNRLCIASLEEPYGRNGERLVDVKGITQEEIFAIGVYRLFPFVAEKHISWGKSIFEKEND